MKPRRSATDRLADLGEDAVVEIIERLLPVGRGVIAGSGDDAAVVRSPGKDLIVLKTDCVVENVHFDRKALPESIGWKAMMRPLSDFAAISGIPEFALVTLIVDRGRKMSWVSGVYRGLARAARRFEVSIVGGETSAAQRTAAISVSIAGRVEKNRWVSRHGGKPGDHLFVTGRLGGSIRGKHLRFIPRIEESRWLTANFRIHAMMDLSDGLGADLPRLAKASKVGFHLDYESIPRTRGISIKNAISDGEDFELLFAVSPNDSQRLQVEWRRKFPRLKLTKIGTLNRKSSPSRTGSNENRKFPRGYVHFQ
jgi:thiamine-monophosphate kinase